MIEPVAKQDRKTSYYLFEKIPGILFVSTLAFLVIGGIFFPEQIAYVILILNVFFLYRSGSLALYFTIAYFRIRQHENTPWQSKLEGIVNKPATLEQLKHDLIRLEAIDPSKQLEAHSFPEKPKNLILKFTSRLPNFFKKIIAAREKQKVARFLRKEMRELEKVETYADWRDIQHVVMIPHVKEPEHILRETLDNLRKQTFPTKQINVVLAAESRDPNGLPLSLKLAEEYKEHFNNIWVSNHVLTDEEIVGKSSNMKAAGRVAYEEVQKLGWDLKKTLITSCDADSKLPHQYFSYVTYKFITTQDPEYKFFNAAMVFYNNIWRLPFYARVKNSMSSLYNTARLVRTDKLVPFSTYTASFWAIKEVGFWTPWVTPEDFHLFFKVQFKYGALVSVVPIYLRIMSDAAEGKGHIDTIRNNYMQERRWAWGISDDGWVLQNIFAYFTKLEFITLYRGLHSVFDHVMGPVMGIVLLIGGNLPPLLNPDFNRTVLGAQLPAVSSTIITFSLVFMVFVIILDYFYRPKKDKGFLPLNIVLSFAEWLVLPWASFFLAVLPGLEANTRLLFGQYLEYYVTKKH